jgi:hypothetical protein
MAYVKIITPIVNKATAKTTQNYNVIAKQPIVNVVKVQGLFPSIFNGTQIIVENITKPEANEDFDLS